MALRLNRKHMALVLGLGLSGAWAQPFKLRCDVEGKFPESLPKVAPSQVTVELQLIGSHLYFKVIGLQYYEMRVSTLESEAFKGVNLNSGSRIGARRQERSSQRETQIVIDRGSMSLTAHHDVVLAGKTQRFSYAGKCRPA
jgi:hypothetical protein